MTEDRALRWSEKSESTHPTTKRHIPEEFNLQP